MVRVYAPPPKDNPALRPSTPIDYGAAAAAFLESAPAALARADDTSSVLHAGLYLRKAKEQRVEEDDSVPRALTRILRLEDWGRWQPSKALDALVRVPPRPDSIDASDWEWSTAVVRCLLRHNSKYAEETARILRRGDVYFFDPRGIAIEEEAEKVFERVDLSDVAVVEVSEQSRPQRKSAPRSHHCPAIVALIGEEFDALTSSRDVAPGSVVEVQQQSPEEWRRGVVLRRERNALDVRWLERWPDSSRRIERGVRVGRVRLASSGADLPVRRPRRGERNLHRLWHESWCHVPCLDTEHSRLKRESERRRLAARPRWTTT